jgi:hypothetical protein
LNRNSASAAAMAKIVETTSRLVSTGIGDKEPF